MFNNIIYDISNSFPVDKEFRHIYDHYLQLGKQFSTKQRVAILSIVRNISNEYKYALRQTKELLSHFHNDSIVCLYENDSIDFTPSLIQEHLTKHNYSNFFIFSEQLGTSYMPLSKSKIRTSNLAKARNRCFELSKSLTNDIDLFIVLDMDFCNISIDGILNSCGWLASDNRISAICGNSYIDMSSKNKQIFHNYDSFAFRLNYWNYYDPLWFPYFNLPIGSPPIPVYSGFGGSCIYRSKYYGSFYGGDDCEHVVLHKTLKSNFPEFNLYYNTSQIIIVN